MIVVHKKNEVFLKVSTEPSILQEISDHFSFDVPGARFTPLYRAKMWDGKVRLFSMFTGELPVGLLDYLIKYATAQDYPVDVKYTPTADKCTVEQVVEFCQSLRLTAHDKPIIIREYQIDAIHKSITDGRRLLLSPTGSGKSLIIYGLIRWHQKYDRKQLIIVPTTSLVSQMYSDFADYSSSNGWDAKENCHKIVGGVEKNPIFYKLTFENNLYIVCHDGNENIKLINNKTKQIKDLSEEDEISDDWIRQNKHRLQGMQK